MKCPYYKFDDDAFQEEFFKEPQIRQCFEWATCNGECERIRKQRTQDKE